MSDKVKQLLALEAEAVRNIPLDNPFAEVIESLHEAVHRKGGKLVSSGMGKAGEIAANISTTFSSTGTPAVHLHAADAQHGDLGILQKNDILLFVSNSGRTSELLALRELARGLFPGLPLIVITGNRESPLASMADLVLFTGAPREICPLGLTPTTSTTCMTVIGDILIALMMERIKLSPADYALRHHGGYLGQQSAALSHKSPSK